MIICQVCKRWFHEDCVEDDYNSPNWACLRCEEGSKKDRDLQSGLGKLRKASAKKSKETQNVQRLYDAIISIIAEYQLPKDDRHIACFTAMEYDAMAQKKEEKKCLVLQFLAWSTSLS